MANMKQVIDIIDDMYSKYSPLYLSQIGQRLRDEGVGYENLQATINNSGIYVLVHHPYIKEKIAVAKNEDRDKILHRLQGSDNDFFTTLPRAFVYAFCQSAEYPTYLSLDFPVKYHNEQDEEGSRKEVPSAYKIDIEGYKIDKLPQEKQDKLKENIENWCEKNNIDLASLRLTQKEPTPKKVDVSVLKKYLSEDIISLIEAQPDDVRKNMVIPLAFFLK